MSASFAILLARRHPLATAFVGLLALPMPALAANTWPVTNCNDSGPGSLRAVIGAGTTLSDDTVDMSGLSCSTISLTTGAIAVTQSSLIIKGPGQNKLTISGKNETDRIFNHTGTGGTLLLYYLSMSYGDLKPATGNARGGCIYSAGSVVLQDIGVYSCTAAAANSSNTNGGGVFAKGSVTINYSTVSGNIVNLGTSSYGSGGGIYATSDFVARYSTVSFNSVTAASGRSYAGLAGAASVGGNVSLRGTTVSGNSANESVGGIDAYSFNPSGLTTTIINSTISGNSSGGIMGGVLTNSGKVYLNNSTVAFNTAATGRNGSKAPFTYFCPGVAISDHQGPVAVTMQSTLIANNTYGSGPVPTEYDLSVPNRNKTTVTFSGANNLVRATNAAVPAGTIKISCPLLGPLRNNGGLTQTHALLSKSPGIAQGNNPQHLAWDQRGSPFARLSAAPPGGTAPTVPDIGAYEVQQNDIIFNNGFDGCPALD